MKITRFEEIIAWQKARALTQSVYREFQSNKDYSYKDQIQRASVSIMNNIAEGFERQGNREFKNFLFIAKGSCAEVRSMIYLAFDLQYMSNGQINELLAKTDEISRLLSGLIKTL
jgi:four helix bundle protein